MGIKTCSWMRTLALGALMSFSIVDADPDVEEQKPVADPLADAFDDSVWTSSPLYERAVSLMKESPLVDTHIDLPQVIRSLGQFRISFSIIIHDRAPNTKLPSQTVILCLSSQT